MTEDLLERTITEGLAARADRAAPGEASFDDVEGRAIRLRRQRGRRTRLVGVAALVLLVATIGVVARGGPAADDLVVGPTEPGSGPTSVAGAPTGRWAVLPHAVALDVRLPTDTTAGPMAQSPTLELTPYLLVAPTDDDNDVLYALDAKQWSLGQARFVTDDGTDVETVVVDGEAFDLGRFSVVPNPYNAFRPASGGPEAQGTVDPNAGTPSPYIDASPAELLAAPASHPLTPPIERLGAYDWMVAAPSCEEGTDACQQVAVGGDGETLVVVTARSSSALDLRDHLRALELRSTDPLARPRATDPSVPDPGEPGEGTRLGYGWFLLRARPMPPDQAPPTVPRDDSVWPAEVPADYCTAYRSWKQTQMVHLGSFGTAGWIRWVQALAAMAPVADVGEAYTVLAAEQSAGHDPSATEPGVSALTTVVDDGDARCPA